MEELNPCKCGSSDIGEDDEHWVIDGYHVRLFCNICFTTTSMQPSWQCAVDAWNEGDVHQP